MNKNIIKLSESQLREMISESVKKVLKESLRYDGTPSMLDNNNVPKKIYYVIFACSDNYFKKEEKKFKERDKALAYAIEKIQATYFKRELGDSEDVTEVIKAFKDEFILNDSTYEFYVNANGDECFVGLCDASQVRDIRGELSELRLDRFDIR